MKRKRINNILKSILICLVVLIGFQLGTNANHIKTSLTNTKETNVENQAKKVALMDLNQEYCDAKCILDKNDKVVTFLTKTFGINKDAIVDNLMEINKDSAVNELNIGKITDAQGNLVSYNSFDRGLIVSCLPIYFRKAIFMEPVCNQIMCFTSRSSSFPNPPMSMTAIIIAYGC